MVWTNVSKPGVQSWISVSFAGKVFYDDTTVTYDSATTFYDGFNPAQWTDIAKPTTPASWVSIAKPT